LASQALVSRSLLEQLTFWGDSRREAILVPYVSVDAEMPTQMDQEVGQGVIFRYDFKHHIHTLSTQTQYELASLAQSIVILVASPFSVFGEIYRLCDGSINASTCLKSICTVPKHIIFSIFKPAFYVGRSVTGIASAASIGVGFLTWHAGEKVVHLIAGSSPTVLSNNLITRNKVYHLLGLTLLAAGAVFIPVAPIQMIALPIILGSIYGTLNNQFTVRECPEYYTMDHNHAAAVVHFEQKYQELICRPFNLHETAGFDYLIPNELNPQDIAIHFARVQNAQNGTCVTAGTERAVFDLLLGDFECVINIDIEPKVTAYMNFLILLGRITKDQDCEDFRSLAAAVSFDTIKDEIAQRISLSDMPEHMKIYYRENLERYARIFYSVPKNWTTDSSFSNVNYYINPVLLGKFQKYAREGKFISICGDINDLTAFDRVVAIDTSNIYFYNFINPSLSPSSDCPLIIWTCPKIRPHVGRGGSTQMNWNFYSYRFTPFDPMLRGMMNQLIQRFLKVHRHKCLRGVFQNVITEAKKDLILPRDREKDKIYTAWISKLTCCRSDDSLAADLLPPTSPSLQLYQFLKDYEEKNFYDATRIGLDIIDFGVDLEMNEKINNATPEQLKELFADPNISQFLPQMIKMMILNWMSLSEEKKQIWFEGVSHIQGFREAFEEYCKRCCYNQKSHFDECRQLYDFISILEDKGSLQSLLEKLKIESAEGGTQYLKCTIEMLRAIGTSI